jgi:hypothetical protein
LGKLRYKEAIQFAKSHIDMWVTFSPGIVVGTENYYPTISGEDSLSNMSTFDEGLRYSRDLKLR